MRIKLQETPHTPSEKGFFSLCYGIENPLNFSIQELLKSEKKDIDQLKTLFPERWVYKLYYRYEGQMANEITFSTSYSSQQELEDDFINGIPVADPSTQVTMDAIEAFSVCGAIIGIIEE